MKVFPFSILVLLALSGRIQANGPVEWEAMAIQKAQPKKVVRHGVEVRSRLDAARHRVMVEGPRYHSSAVGMNAADEESLEARYNWYAIGKTQEGTSETIAVAVSGNTGMPFEFELAEPVYFLSTAQDLTGGQPAGVPGKLSHFLAYRIVDKNPSESGEKSGVPTGKRTNPALPGRPVFVCLPAEEWHHHDYYPVEDPRQAFIVCETEAKKEEGRTDASALDQLGLHSLRLQSAKLAGFAARIVETP